MKKMPNYPKRVTTIVKSDESPTGTILIGKYEPPFVEVKNGYGYYGVLKMTGDQKLIQCHVCGRWLQQLVSHLQSKHEISNSEYRKKYGLLNGTALCNERIRSIHAEVMSGLREKYPRKCGRKFKINNLDSANRLNKPKALESKNKYGVCHDQLIAKVVSLKEKIKRTPTIVELNEKYGCAFGVMLHYTFGGYLNLLKQLKWQPQFSAFNPKYSKKFLTEAIKMFYRVHKRMPMCSDSERGLIPPHYAYQYYFGKKGFTTAKKEVAKRIKKSAQRKEEQFNK